MADNVALAAAARRAEQVIPLFILEDAWRTDPEVGAARLAFLLQSVACLRERLATLGYSLVIRRGDSRELLPQLCAEFGAQAVFANKGYEPYVQRRDEQITAALLRAGRGFELFKDAVVCEEREVLTQAGNPFTVFTPYSRAWKSRPLPAPVPGLLAHSGPVQSFKSDPLPASLEELGLGSAPGAIFCAPAENSGRTDKSLARLDVERAESRARGRNQPRPGRACSPTQDFGLTQTIPAAGETAALELLQRFMAEPVYAYADTRDFPARAGTSGLSPHLHAGTIGIRTILAALARARARATTPAQAGGCDVFLNELIWREFYQQVLVNFPHVTTGAFRPEYDRLAWSDNREHFAAWCAGRTGYPIVDAAMRCLNATGTMPNRLRMVVAMFLTKDLLIHWQWGERYFMQQLVDGDLAANNGGWQWSAGTGTDAAPYFRIFNPVSQGEKFDPAGGYVRRWVPELADFPDDLIHQPWENPLRCARAKYPERMVLHAEQRVKCLAMFKAVKPGIRPAAGAFALQ